ncbi:MAG TPA: hypothetical protein VGX76_23840 [Pirellulales bacterium]|nr:hypothetical protein [Pirellulales bacterium]
MFHTALGRGPSAAEIARWTAALDDLAALHHIPADDVMTSQALWKEMAHAMFNLKEFIYIQ